MRRIGGDELLDLTPVVGAALVKNSIGRYYVMVVETDRVADFNAYIREERHEVIEWLDERAPVR